MESKDGKSTFRIRIDPDTVPDVEIPKDFGWQRRKCGCVDQRVLEIAGLLGRITAREDLALIAANDNDPGAGKKDDQE